MEINLDKMVVLNVKKDARNNVITTVQYNGGNGLQDAFDMDDKTEAFACSICRKIFPGNSDGIVIIDAATKEEVRLSDVDLRNVNCFISGTDPGYAEKVVRLLRFGTENPDIMTPFYITDGNDYILVNKNGLNLSSGRSPLSEQELMTVEKKISEMLGVDPSSGLRK